MDGWTTRLSGFSNARRTRFADARGYYPIRCYLTTAFRARSNRMFVARARRVLCSAAVGWPTLAVGQPTAPLPMKHAPQPTVPAITAGDLMTRLYIFADDSMMGREVGTPSHLKATAYLEREVRRIGLVPGGDDGTFFQNLPLYEHALAQRNAITVDGKRLAAGTDYIPRDNSIFGGRVRSIDGAQAVYGGVFAPRGDTGQVV